MKKCEVTLIMPATDYLTLEVEGEDEDDAMHRALATPELDCENWDTSDTGDIDVVRVECLTPAGKVA